MKQVVIGVAAALALHVGVQPSANASPLGECRLYVWGDEQALSLQNHLVSTQNAESGERIGDVASRLRDGTLSPHDPCRIAFVMVGGHDIRRDGATADGVYAELRALWALARERGFRVVAATLSSRADVNNSQPIQTRAGELNRLILSDSSAFDAVVRADAILPDFNNLSFFHVDGVALADDGSRRLAAYVRKAMQPSVASDQLFETDRRDVQCQFREFSGLQPYIASHKADGSYLAIGSRFDPADWPVPFDDEGLPLTAVSQQHHPLTISQFALMNYERMLAGSDEASVLFDISLARLMSMVDANGGLPYPDEFNYYLTRAVIRSGWYSPIAQGQALSALARGYEVSGDPAILDKGREVLDLLLKDRAAGGLRSDTRYLPGIAGDLVWFEEYDSGNAHAYTLGGFLVVMLGLHDWSRLATDEAGARRAAEAFTDSVRSLEAVLPFYDTGFFSTYDLGYITHPGTPPRYGLDYHEFHITALAAIYSTAPRPAFAATIDRWTSYIDEAKAVDCD